MKIAEGENLIVAYKPVGYSPLDLLKKLKEKYPELRNKKMAYAGRLDPLAEGIVLFVIGEELKNFDSYLTMDKRYEARILFGFSSDTYDVLGIPQKKDKKNLSEEEVRKALESFKGSFNFSLPPFSGYKVKKKPLFRWALEGRLKEVSVPRKKANVYSLEVLEIHRIKEGDLRKEILGKIGEVKGDFRQRKITECWEKILTTRRENYLVARLDIFCSSGCYVRSVADEVGKKTETGAVLLDLKRTKVGDYDISQVVFPYDA